jgi:transcriptional regulator with XRE-family HTH domain
MSAPHVQQKQGSSLDIKLFAEWVRDLRTKQNLSLEALAREITHSGYPISQNKLFRLEQNLKEPEEQKRPLTNIDYELKLRLESVFGRAFPADKSEIDVYKELMPAADVFEMLQDIECNGPNSVAPEHPLLQLLHERMVKVLSRSKELEEENDKLRKAVSDLTLEKMALAEIAKANR